MRGESMNPAAPLEVELDVLFGPEDRRPISVESHQAFRESITTKPPADPIDELVGELREIEADEEAASP
jgi:hypothetical protein